MAGNSFRWSAPWLKDVPGNWIEVVADDEGACLYVACDWVYRPVSHGLSAAECRELAAQLLKAAEFVAEETP